MKSKSIIHFGEKTEGYAVPVLNEREIRAAAGIMFLGLFTALALVLFNRDFLAVKYVILIFLTDFVIRVLINPQFSPTLIIGRLIVSRQAPEYVGAPQKRFAWSIGLVLSGTMFFLLVLLNTYSLVTVSICVICLVFLFFETAFGICLGCLVYPLFFKQKPLYCVGGDCASKMKQDIQRTSASQVAVGLTAILFILTIILIFNGYLDRPPHKL